MDRIARLVKSPFCHAVLSRFIDLTDAIALEDRSRNVGFRLNEKIAKSLYAPSEPGEDDEAWFALCELSREGWFRIELGKAGHGEAEFMSKPRPRLILNPQFEAEIRKFIGREERANARLLAWRQHVDQVRQLFPGSVEKLKFLPLEVEGMSDRDVLNRLGKVSTYIGKNLYLRELSARLFDGASKVLDGKGHIISELYGLDLSVFPERPISLAVHLPSNWSGSVLFVENETTFVSLSEGRFAPAAACALVYSTGFKASASRIRGEGRAFLTYTTRSFVGNEIKRFEEWLLGAKGELDSFFWGDLDFAGAQILGALRLTFPGTLAWEPGYLPMLTALKSGVGHQPAMADKEAQIDPGTTGCAFMDNDLLPSMRSTGLFLDQEYV